MTNILFYGNCQMTPLKKTLNLDETKYNQTIIECFKTDIEEEEIKSNVSQADIIIMSLIEDNYRDKHYLSTTYIIFHSKQKCQIIILNNLYFNFYYFDTQQIKFREHLIPYHHDLLFENYKNNKSVDFYINNYVNNKLLKTKYELECLANNSFEELDKRYENILLHKQFSPDKCIYSIPISNYIKDNYKDKLLFYAINHPSKYIFQYISEEILSILNLKNTINYDIDILFHTRYILYDCIQKVVFFDIKNVTPLIDGKTNIKDISQWYYDLYKKNEL